MTLPSLLVAKYNLTASASATAEIGRLLGTEFVPEGSTVVSNEVKALAGRPDAKVCEFLGTAFAWIEDRIYRWSGSAWVSIHGPFGDQLDNQSKTGLHVVYDAGTPTLIGVYITSGSDFKAVSSTNGTSWSTSSALGPSATGGTSPSRAVVFQNTLIFNSGDTVAQGGWLYDHEAGSLTATTFATITIGTGSYYAKAYAKGPDAAGQDTLYVLANSNQAGATSSEDRLWELSGAVWTSVATLGSTDQNGGNIGETGGHALFSDGTDMFAFVCHGDGSFGTAVYKIDTAFSVTDLTTTVLPAAYQLSGAQTDENARWWVFGDNDTDPAGVPSVWLFYAEDVLAETPLHIFQWAGDAAEMVFFGSYANSNELALPNTSQGGGDRIWAPDAINAMLTQEPTVVPGGFYLDCIVFGGGVADKVLSFRYTLQGSAALSLCTLEGVATVVSGPGGVPTRVGNEIQGIDADGVTVYRVRWGAFVDGISASDFPIVFPHFES